MPDPPTVKVVPLAIVTVPELVKLLEAVVSVAPAARANVPVLVLKPESALLAPSLILAVVPVKVRLAALVTMPPFEPVSCSVPPMV